MHFFVMVVPGRHVIFSHSDKHNAKAIDKILGDYKGYIVADAHAIYDHLYFEDSATEVGCWGHARAYFFKTLGSEPEIAHEFIANLRKMFLLERKFADKTRKQRERMRRDKVKSIVDRHFELRRSLRGAQDMVARYGGEEMACILPGPFPKTRPKSPSAYAPA